MKDKSKRGYPLKDLSPAFIAITEGGYRRVPTLAEAQGISFVCPYCLEQSKTGGAHRVVCWSRSAGVPDEQQPGPGRWSMHGKGFADLTLRGDVKRGSEDRASNSVQCGCWHGFITDGFAEILGDSGTRG